MVEEKLGRGFLLLMIYSEENEGFPTWKFEGNYCSDYFNCNSLKIILKQKQGLYLLAKLKINYIILKQEMKIISPKLTSIQLFIILIVKMNGLKIVIY